jgi:hypothetical protein
VDLSVVLVFGLRLIQCCQFALPISISVGRFPASSIESAAASRSFLFSFLARAFGVRHQSDYTLSLWNLVSSVQWFWRPCPLGKSSLVFSLLFLGFPAPGLDFVTGLSFHDFSSVIRESAATYHFSVIVPGPRSRGRSSWLCHGGQVASVRINRRLFCRSTVPSALLPITCEVMSGTLALTAHQRLLCSTRTNSRGGR